MTVDPSRSPREPGSQAGVPVRPERVPLPLDPADLPATDPEVLAALASGLAAMGLVLPETVIEGIDVHMRLLAAWGRHVNLTAIRDPLGVVRLHVLDSLAAVRPVRERVSAPGALVDVGSGGGYPGIPLGLALAVDRLSLVDSVGRKTRFLEVVGAAVRTADLEAPRPAVEVLTARAEALAQTDRRASWDVATVRAVGSLAGSAELGLPLLRAGGLLVCWKRDPVGADGLVVDGSVLAEVADARAVIERLGGGAPEVVAAGVPGAPGHRLVLVPKVRPTPASYPRQPAARRTSAAGPRRATTGSRRRS